MSLDSVSCPVPRLAICEFDPEIHKYPVIITGCNIGTCLSWSADYLASQLSAKEVIVHKSCNPILKFQPKNFSYVTLNCDSFIREASKGPATEFFYLRSLAKSSRDDVADFRQDFPEISKDVIFPPLFDEKQFFSSVFRVSSPGMELWTHYDTMDNYLLHISGAKRIYLFPPKDVSHLYMMGDKPQIFDLDNVHLDEYPHLSKCNISKCILQPGDVLFIPSFWFHNVKSLNFG